MSFSTTKEYQSEYGRNYRQKCKERGVCQKCAKNPVCSENNQLCEGCRKKDLAKHKELYNSRIEKGLCRDCGNDIEDKKYKTCGKCRERHRNKYQKTKEHCLKWGQKYRKDLKIAAFEAYGGAVCNCQGCNEKRLNFLAIDHINNDGYEHRKNQGKGVKIYRWLKKNNYPEGYQVLCHNCNWSKHANGGKCDHELEGYIHPEKRQDCKAIVYNSFDNYINGKGEELTIKE